MTLEILDIKRCCFCFPLRAGLLTWSYFKMIADVLMTPILAYFMLLFLAISLYLSDVEFFAYAVLTLIALIAVIANFIAVFTFIIGGHQKKLTRIRGFYNYSIWELKVMTLLIVMTVGITVKYWRASAAKTHLEIFAIYLLILVLHAYFLLLLKSEVNKLQNNESSEISYVNNSAEAEYILTSKEREAAIANV